MDQHNSFDDLSQDVIMMMLMDNLNKNNNHNNNHNNNPSHSRNNSNNHNDENVGTNINTNNAINNGTNTVDSNAQIIQKANKKICSLIDCKRKLGIMLYDNCKCGFKLCDKHRLPTYHNCTY